jgi:putative CocE/NonD family hydrolase
MLHISGWYDDCLGGATQNFAAMSSMAADPLARTTQRLLIGPWMHDTIGKRDSGGTDYGEAAEIDIGAYQRDWFGKVLLGKEDASAPVRLFVMGRNEWIEEQAWPIARTRYVPWYFHSSGKANSRRGDGNLSPVLPEDEPADTFFHNPADPIPYSANFDWKQVGGPDDFAQIELREDMLVFTSAPLAEPLLICGPLLVRLFASSSAPDTDWTAKVIDVHPDGRAIRLNDGAVRARFRHGGPAEAFLTPGQVEEYQIDCWSTCIEIAAGHSLRVEIASSAFGKIDVNMNGGGRIGHETIAYVAQQTVFHDALHPSHLLVPIVEGRS